MIKIRIDGREITNHIAAYSHKIMEFDKPSVINYHPHNPDQYYQDSIPSYIQVREFDLEKSKEKIIKSFINKINSYPLRDEEKDAR